MKIVRKSRPDEDDADVFYVERAEKHGIVRSESSFSRRLISVTLLIVLIVGATLAVQKLLGDSPQDTRSVVMALQGKKVLDEKGLRDLVVSQKLTVYWVGPKVNYKYVISSYPDGQVFVRYLPDGKGLEDTSATFLVIATYPQADAFVTTQTRASENDGLGFTNVDGNAVYYTTSRPLSVYVGLRDANFQVEIYDPVAGQALISARTAGFIRKIM